MASKKDTRSKRRISERVLAIALVMVMLLSLIPLESFISKAAGDKSWTFTVKDSNQSPLADVTITVNETDYSTDVQGQAVIAGLDENGEYSYKVKKIGYSTVEDTFVVAEPYGCELQLNSLRKKGIHGTVVDQNNHPVPMALVTLQGYADYSTTTDGNGVFSINDVYEENYTLSVTKDTFKTITQPLVFENENRVSLIPKENETLQFEQSTIRIAYGDEVSVVASTNSGVADIYESLKTSVLTVDNDGKITTTGIGSATIKATKSESDDYLESNAWCTVIVEKGEQKALEWALSVPDNLTWKDTFTNTVNGGSGTGIIRYSSSNEAVAQVNASTGVVTFSKPGSAIITATKAGDTYYKSATAVYAITVGKAKQPDLKFQETSPNDLIFGDNSYCNTAAPEEGQTLISDEITYESSDTSVITVDETGLLTTHKQGQNIKITARSAGNALYEDATASYVITVLRADQAADFKFAKSSYEQATVFGEAYQNEASGGENAPIGYSSSDNSIATVDSDGNVTAKKAGIVIITATNPADDRYNAKSISYRLTINKADQTVEFEKTEIPVIKYGESFTNKLKAKSNVTYTSADENIAKVDANGVITTVNPGTVKITAVANEDDCYYSAEDSYTIQITKNDQVITFENGLTPEITFNDNDNKFSNKATSSANESSIHAFYSITSGYASADLLNNGELKIKGAGTVVVKAKFNGNNHYNAAEKTYSLTINKSAQEIYFDQAVYSVDTGDKRFVSPEAKDKDQNKRGVGNVTYEYTLISGDASAIKSFNPSNGKYKIGKKTGVFKVTATKAEDANYLSAVSSYELHVGYYDPGKKYTIVGTKADENTSWYVDKNSVKIKANEGYQVSFINDDSVTWYDELSVAAKLDEGENQVTFFVKETSSGRTTAECSETIMLDSVDPMVEVKESTERITSWSKILSILTFSEWKDEGITLAITAEDETSNVKAIEYYDSPDVDSVLPISELQNKTWENCRVGITTEGRITYRVNENEGKKGITYIRVTDNAGRMSYGWTNGIVFEGIKPELLLNFDDTNGVPFSQLGDNDRIYGGDVWINVSALDQEPHTGIRTITYSISANGGNVTSGEKLLYGSSLSSNPSYSDLVQTFATTIQNAIHVEAYRYNYDDVIVTVTVEDNAGNATTKSIRFGISKDRPRIEIDGDEDEHKNEYENIKYYSSARKEKVSVVCRNSVWDENRVKITLVDGSMDEEGNPPVFTHGSWVTEGDTHYTFVTFGEEAEGGKGGRYQYKVEFTNKVEREADSYTSSVFVVDQNAPSLVLTPEKSEIQHDGVNVYNKSNVDVNIVSKDQSYSKIKMVEYWVEYTIVNRDDPSQNKAVQSDYRKFVEENNTDVINDTDSGALNLLDIINHAFDQTIQIYADDEINNSCDVKVRVKVTDFAEQTAENTIRLDIDVTAPEIKLSYMTEPGYTEKMYSQDANGRGYFPSKRMAEIRIVERSDHFDYDKVKFTVEAKDSKGNKVTGDLYTVEYGKAEYDSSDPNGDVHTIKIAFNGDANYTLSGISCTDLAGNVSDGVDTTGTLSPYEFTVDTKNPTGSVSVEKLGTWNKLLEVLTFGLWSKASVKVTGDSADVTSPIKSVSYYKTDDTTAKKESELKNVEDWKAFGNGFSVSPNERFVVYLRIVDMAGNTTYISSNGIIVDDAAPEIESIAPEITITPPQPVNDLYNTDVDVDISVVDPDNNGAYSGLSRVSYTVLNQGTVTQSGDLLKFDTLNGVKQTDLKRTLASTIRVDKIKNNSNEVEIRVYAVDNSGNESEKSQMISIDVTNPKISVSYDNNDGDTSFADGTTDAFFRATRTATIVVTERNFDPEDVVVTITNTDGVIPSLSGWSTSTASGNGDNTTHTATITYSADGDYTFEISCKDRAGNQCDEPTYNGVAPRKFTIDQTLPTFSVSYDNNDVTNEIYYKAKRTATLTIVEHNFEASRVQARISATDDGSTVTAPVISGWSSNGDTHTATINYDADAQYLFDIDYSDKAGNAIVDFAEQRFYVDTVNPVVTISKIVDESANNSNGNIGFVITATDTNFDVFVPSVTVVVRNGDGFETKKVDVGSMTDTKNGKIYTVNNLEADGIYRISCTVVDKAGNAFSEVGLSKEDGSSYTAERSGNDTLITFSVNREGSAFEVDANTQTLLEKYYVQRVENDLVMVEVNADPLQSYKVTLNGEEIPESQYGVEVTEGEGGWKKYTYILSKTMFDAEGEYNIVVYSKDKASNDAFSDVKGTGVRFVVDRTAPVVTVTGLADNGRYQTESQLVTLVPTDDGGALKSILVTLVDDDGKVIKELVNLSGEEFLNALEANDGKITFEVAEGLYQNVRVVCDDEASYEGTENVIFDKTYNNVSVTSNAFLIFWANKPLRWGVIAAVIALIAGGVFFVVMKRRKNGSRA